MRYFCVFGNPVSHSISPRLHNIAYKLLKVKANYSKELLEDSKDLKKRFFECGYDGANITVPHKEEAFSSCDKVFGIAKEIGAVNTIIKKEGKLFGYNTDAPGFMKSIEDFDKIVNILILGAGGSARAISFALKQRGFNVSLLNRSVGRLEFFKNSGFTTFTYSDNLPDNYDLIINTTSAGLKDDNLPCPKDTLIHISKNAKYCVDIIYNKLTPFLQFCKERGIVYKDGSDMLLYQALFAFNIFFDGKYKEDEIESAMRIALSLNPHPIFHSL